MSEIVSQQVVWFYNDELTAVQRSDGTIFVSFHRLCENLSVDRRSQVRRVENHIVLNKGFVTIELQTEGGPQETQCLRLDLLPLWLAGLQVKRAKEETREKLARYQTEAAIVLWNAFKPQILVQSHHVLDEETQLTEVSQSVQELQRIAELGEAITQMARQQIEIQRQQDHLAGRLDRAGHVVKGVQDDITTIQIRLGSLEDQLHPAAYITDEQATHISNTVKALAELLTRKEGKNQYQGVFGELKGSLPIASLVCSAGNE